MWFIANIMQNGINKTGVLIKMMKKIVIWHKKNCLAITFARQFFKLFQIIRPLSSQGI